MWKWLPAVRTGSPRTKERYCSIVSIGGVDTGKSNIQGERKKRGEREKVKGKKMEKIMN